MTPSTIWRWSRLLVWAACHRRKLPDKAIDLDGRGGRQAARGATMPDRPESIARRLPLTTEEEAALGGTARLRACYASFKVERITLQQEFDVAQHFVAQRNRSGRGGQREDIAEVVATWTGIPDQSAGGRGPAAAHAENWASGSSARKSHRGKPDACAACLG